MQRLIHLCIDENILGHIKPSDHRDPRRKAFSDMVLRMTHHGDELVVETLNLTASKHPSIGNISRRSNKPIISILVAPAITINEIKNTDVTETGGKAPIYVPVEEGDHPEAILKKIAHTISRENQ